MLGGVERDRVLGGIRDPVVDPFQGMNNVDDWLTLSVKALR